MAVGRRARPAEATGAVDDVGRGKPLSAETRSHWRDRGGCHRQGCVSSGTGVSKIRAAQPSRGRGACGGKLRGRRGARPCCARGACAAGGSSARRRAYACARAAGARSAGCGASRGDCRVRGARARIYRIAGRSHCGRRNHSRGICSFERRGGRGVCSSGMCSSDRERGCLGKCARCEVGRSLLAAGGRGARACRTRGAGAVCASARRAARRRWGRAAAAGGARANMC